MKIILYLHMHQPWRLARFRYVDLGSGRSYFDVERNLSIFRAVADRCYRPTLRLLSQLLEKHPEFAFSISLTGTFVEQAREAAPDLLPVLRRLFRTGRVSLLAETYYHSLAFLLPPPELQEEVHRHVQTVRELFAVRPRILRMTELAYSDGLAEFARQEGFRGMLAEGWEGWLGGRSPNYLYASAAAPPVKLLLRNYPMSDDVGFRFSARDWSEYPLTSEKYARWLAGSPGDRVGLFMDFETFGEHHIAATGILDFLAALPGAVARERHLAWSTVEEAMEDEPQDALSSPRVITWADQQRDLGAWLGNDLQHSAFHAARSLEDPVRRAGDPSLLATWRRLLTSDHFYYMYLGGHGADRGVHNYFSSYTNPYDAYANYMNALSDLRQRLMAAGIQSPSAPPPTVPAPAIGDGPVPGAGRFV
jgi:alpha-amylase